MSKNKKPRKKYTPKIAVGAPMLVCRGLVNDRLETMERMIVEAFCGGWATMEHFDRMADMQGVLLLGASVNAKDRHHTKWCRDTFGPVLGSIRGRFERTGKFGCNAEELAILRGFVTRYRDFWMTKPHSLYEIACDQLNDFYAKMAREQDQKGAANGSLAA